MGHTLVPCTKDEDEVKVFFQIFSLAVLSFPLPSPGLVGVTWCISSPVTPCPSSSHLGGVAHAGLGVITLGRKQSPHHVIGDFYWLENSTPYKREQTGPATLAAT